MTFLGGVSADRIGRRPIVAIGRLLRSIGWATVVLFPKPVGLAVGAALLGAGGLAGSAYRAIAESAAPGRRASAFAIAIVVESLMGMVMPPVVGLAAARLGLQPVLVLAAVLSGAAVAALMRRVKETMVPHGGAAAGPPGLAASELSAAALDRPPSPWDSLRFMAGPEGRGAALMAVVWLFTGFGMGLIPPIWGLYVTDRFGVGYAALEAISTSMSLGMVIGSLLGGHVADRVVVLFLITIGRRAGWRGFAAKPVGSEAD